MVAALGLERYQCDQIGRFLKVLGLGTVGISWMLKERKK